MKHHNMNPFHDDSKNQQSITIAEQHARQLFKLLKEAQILTAQRVSIPQWVKTFEVLHDRHGARTVGELLNWYCEHIAHGITPPILSAKAFGIYWQTLERLMLQSLPKIEVSHDAERMKDWLMRDLVWSREVKDNFTQLIQRSLNNYRPFQDAFYEIYETVEGLRNCEQDKDDAKHNPLFSFYNDMLCFTRNQWDKYYSSWDTFICNWFVENHYGVNHTRSVFRYVWRCDHPDWIRVFSNWMYDYDPDMEDWRNFLDAVVHFQKTGRLEPGNTT